MSGLYTEDVEEALRLWSRVREARAMAKYINNENAGQYEAARSVAEQADRDLYDFLSKLKERP